MAAEANIPQSDATVAPEPAGAMGSEEIGVVTGEVSGGVNASTEATPPAEQTPTEDAERSFQGRYDRLQHKVGKDLLPLIEEAGGGSNLANIVNGYKAMLSDPTMSGLIKQFAETCQVSVPQQSGQTPETEDDYKDPLEEKYDPRIAQLEQQLNELRGTLQSGQAERGAEKIGDFTKKFLGEYDLDPTEREEWQQTVDAKLSAMSTQNGAHLLNHMNYEGFKALAFPAVEPFLPNVFARRQQQNQSELSRMATDAPGASTVVQAESHAPMGQPKNQRDLVQLAREAVRKASQGA